MTQRGGLVPGQLVGHPADRRQALQSWRVLEAVLQNPYIRQKEKSRLCRAVEKARELWEINLPKDMTKQMQC